MAQYSICVCIVLGHSYHGHIFPLIFFSLYGLILLLGIFLDFYDVATTFWAQQPDSSLFSHIFSIGAKTRGYFFRDWPCFSQSMTATRKMATEFTPAHTHQYKVHLYCPLIPATTASVYLHSRLEV
jgi:hypothetical protein